MESARPHPVIGRYSILAGDPFEVLTAKGRQITVRGASGTRRFEGDPLEALQQRLDEMRAVRVPGLPPFVGGGVGFFGFDLYRLLERVPARAVDDLRLPDLQFFFTDSAVVIDHEQECLWIVALAEAGVGPDRAYDAAMGRIEKLRERLARDCRPSQSVIGEAAPARSTHTRESFGAMVREAKRFIADGDIYQANLSQRFSAPLQGDPWAFYRRLQAINPSPFSAFAEFDGLTLVSASPERFLRVRRGLVETRPIAGTRPRGRTAAENARLRQALILNDKERAEHLMLVDLERNDLGRVCRYGSVRVDELMALEEYSHVIHIVSNVRGRLKPETRPVDLVAATFPGGTITGCPKLRSIEIIDRLEPVRRQLYTGALGYISATGDMDLNLLIRTAFIKDGTVHVQAGAGIVADSDPGLEYEETVHKARALLETFHAEVPTEELVGAS